MSESRHTFTIPPGFEAVRDHEGRATGEIRPVTPATELVGRLLEPCRDFGGEMIVRESTPRYEIHCDLLYDAAAEIARLTRELDEWTAWGEGLSPAELSNGMDNIKRRAEADLARAREALERIASLEGTAGFELVGTHKITIAGETSYGRTRQGIFASDIARSALPNTTGEAE